MLHQDLYQNHELFKEKSLKHRRFKQADILPLIQKLPFEKMVVGKSFEGREIVKIAIGEGPINILLWSQMHGNEATATMALMDIFNFLNTKNDQFQAFRELIFKKFTLHFIPMLNPDGSQRFQRRTAQGIDMNRDAIELQCPESKILKDNVVKLNPMFSFNLHDQGIRWGAGMTGKQATISFLATAYNEAREWNVTRTRSRQVITAMEKMLQQYIPGQVARYSDEFEPRAFGDNIQKWGSSLILIESGGYKNDIEKQHIRKLNFVSILTAFEQIANDNYNQYSLEEYQNIPQNEKTLFDLKIENAKYKIDNKIFNVALGINTEEKNNAQATKFTHSSVIEDMGDLSVFYGLETIDAKGGLLMSFHDFPDLLKKHKQQKSPRIIEINQSANFVINHNDRLTLIINGKIVS